METMLINVHDVNKTNRKRPRSQLQRTPSEALCFPAAKKCRTTAKKSVRFLSTVTVLTPDSVTTPDNWYSRQDNNRFKSNIKRDVHHLGMLCKANAVATVDQTEYCLVGLERYCCSAEFQKQCKQMKQKRVQVVLDLQYGQKQIGVRDDEAICCAAERYSALATKRALLLAARLC